MSSHSPDPAASLATSAYMVDQASLTSDDELASLPSETTTDSDLDLDSEYSDAEAEWRESIEQLELLLTMVLIPFVGKYLGRKCAYWGWNRFMEWKYPIEMVVGDRAFFKRSGSTRASPSL